MTLNIPEDSLLTERWVVFGASGFVGGAIFRALEIRGTTPSSLQAPRLEAKCGSSSADLVAMLAELQDEIEGIAGHLRSGDIVINAAGLAEPDSPATTALFGANALLPLVLAEAASRAQVRHFLHLSSAAVQGNAKILDTNPHTAAFSAYSQSKSVGESVLLSMSSTSMGITVVRATSVQGPNRSTTQMLQRIASSRLASVAHPGTQPTSVSSIYGLVDFVLATAKSPQELPQIALQPWEGGTVKSVLELAGGGKKPVVLPTSLCLIIIACGRAASRLLGGRFTGHVRRLELMWFGQAQESGQYDSNAEKGPSDNLIRVLSPSPAPAIRRAGS